MIPDAFVNSSLLASRLIAAGDTSLLETDEAGQTYFAGHFNNTAAVADTLTQLANAGYRQEVDLEREAIESLFSDLFDCANFTGRSGGMYAYEGLGSIYWHMVSKLLLAVMETVKRAEQSGAPADVMGGLKRVYYDVREGIGFNKTPDVYGAFPTDPYSHTPGFSGARQPGMTGQVKEEVLTRLLELGVTVDHAQVTFNPTMLRASSTGRWSTLINDARQASLEEVKPEDADRVIRQTSAVGFVGAGLAGSCFRNEMTSRTAAMPVPTTTAPVAR